MHAELTALSVGSRTQSLSWLLSADLAVSYRRSVEDSHREHSVVHKLHVNASCCLTDCMTCLHHYNTLIISSSADLQSLVPVLCIVGNVYQ